MKKISRKERNSLKIKIFLCPTIPKDPFHFLDTHGINIKKISPKKKNMYLKKMCDKDAKMKELIEKLQRNGTNTNREPNNENNSENSNTKQELFEESMMMLSDSDFDTQFDYDYEGIIC